MWFGFSGYVWATDNIHCAALCPVPACGFQVTPGFLIQRVILWTNVCHIEWLFHCCRAVLVVSGRTHMAPIPSWFRVFHWGNRRDKQLGVTCKVKSASGNHWFQLIFCDAPRDPIWKFCVPVVRYCVILVRYKLLAKTWPTLDFFHSILRRTKAKCKND